ncbi:ubiquinone biosynthesis protein COQ9 [Metarhizium anisopliae]|uniref:Ubiquinone biosynthesis protein n=1 Tax=Metarhizium anisopliae BRIP 53293 TaxID=1291518 RepID=A0A0D9PDG5_METAN|nr:ubiquinone biosynthesis protein COQ9 [Metarhizium anisopliae]KJK84153.1 hypothetical protein H634G_00516 [Metarhizium anisopliae BRIP 53293]KJK86310.1 hypothetical protein H633G_09837 [Metarhizium anisopliae BRIP 53284]
MRATPMRPTLLPIARLVTRYTCFTRASFHSYEHPPSAKSFGDVENAILSAAYQHVPEHGFSHSALSLGARDAGYLDISPSALSDGVFSLIQFHLVRQRLALTEKSRALFDTSNTNISGNGIGFKIATLAWARLMANKGIIHRWQEALAVMAQPSYVPASLKELAMLSDEMWYLAGDKAVDSSWYTKRASLSMVYSTSELFMTNDKSPGFVDTRKFLDRRLEEVTTVGGFVGTLGAWGSFTMNAGVNVLRSKGMRV